MSKPSAGLSYSVPQSGTALLRARSALRSQTLASKVVAARLLPVQLPTKYSRPPPRSRNYGAAREYRRPPRGQRVAPLRATAAGFPVTAILPRLATVMVATCQSIAADSGPVSRVSEAATLAWILTKFIPAAFPLVRATLRTAAKFVGAARYATAFDGQSHCSCAAEKRVISAVVHSRLSQRRVGRKSGQVHVHHLCDD